MRISADEQDGAAAVAWAEIRGRGNSVMVTLDGERVAYPMTADDEAGMVVCLVADDDGKMMRDPDRPDRLLTQTLFGRVVIHEIPAKEAT